MSPVSDPDTTGVLRLTLAMVKSSMRKLASSPPSPLRVRFAMTPVIDTIGRSSVGGAGGGGAGGVGSGEGVVDGGVSLTGGPGCVGDVGVSSSSLQAASGSAEASMSARNVCFTVVRVIEIDHSFRVFSVQGSGHFKHEQISFAKEIRTSSLVQKHENARNTSKVFLDKRA